MGKAPRHYIQRGQGIGGIFRGIANLFRKSAPSILKSVKSSGNQLIKSKIAKDIGNHTKDALIDIVQEGLAGKNLQSAAEERLIEGKKRISKDLSSTLESLKQEDSPPSYVKKSRKTNKERKRQAVLDSIAFLTEDEDSYSPPKKRSSRKKRFNEPIFPRKYIYRRSGDKNSSVSRQLI